MIDPYVYLFNFEIDDDDDGVYGFFLLCSDEDEGIVDWVFYLFYCWAFLAMGIEVGVGLGLLL